MARLRWDEIGERLIETGVKKGVLYLINTETKAYDRGVAWNGLTSVSDTPSGGEATDLWADDIKYMSLYSAVTLGGTIEAYTYPDEWQDLGGDSELVKGVRLRQQSRKAFGLSYVTTVANDLEGNDFGYKIHLVYGAMASPSEMSYSSINDSPEANNPSWEYTTTPVNVTGHKPTAGLIIDSTDFVTEEEKARLAAFEDILYGTETADARLPLPDEVAKLLGGKTTTDPVVNPTDPSVNPEG